MFAHNFIVCTKVKQHLILGLDFTQRCMIRIDWLMYGNCFLRHEGKKIATSMKSSHLEQWTIPLLETSSGKQYETDQKLHLITNNKVTLPPYHISIAPLKAINHAKAIALNLIP